MSNWLRRQVCIWAVAACVPLFAQEFRAGISGIVKDALGAAIPKVPVEALNIATNNVVHATTNEAGTYAFPVLPVGMYRITVEAPGFKKATRNNLELRLGDQVQQDFTLEIGAATQEITVSAGAELLQQLASDKGQLVSEENVHDLPSVARNPFLLGIEAAGVQFDIGSNALSRSARPFDAGNNVAESMSINGGSTGSSDLLLDGASSRTPQEIFADTVEILNFAARKAPLLRTLAVRAGQYTESGGTVVQELAFALATGVEYLSELTQRGLGVDEVCSKIFFVFATGSNYFFQIAKLRAFRMMWARAVAPFEPKQADSSKAVVESVTARWGITAYADHNNLLRGATEAMSAAIGGCDSIEVTPFDAAFKPSGDFSRRLARNTQVILKQEAYLDRVADPAGGSYYVEALTDSLAREAWKLFQEVEAKGGLLKAMQSGFVQQEIAGSRRQKDEAIAARRRNLLGTNQYPDQDEHVLDMLEQNGNVTALRTSTSAVKAASSPAELARQFAAGLTLGECLAPSATVFAVEKLRPYRGAEPFEALRLRTERHAAKTGRRPRVLLLEYGDTRMRKARVTFSMNFFAAAGFEIVPAFAEADPVAGAGGDGDDVLERAAQLDANNVVVRVDAEALVHESLLRDGGERVDDH